MKSIARELESIHRELDKVESGLRRVPPDEIVRPLLDELYALHQQSAEASKQVLVADEEIRTSELKLADLQRKHKEAYERLQEAAGQVSKINLVQNLQKVLEEYKLELLEKKIQRLEETVSNCFNALCRKKDELRKIRVHPRNFSVTLYDRRNQPVPKEQLSAGEKQIYAISMLWALAKTSGRPLPVIIDTPLARLDSDHRKLLIHHYFPAASHQVMILSTDTEVDQSYFNELRRDIAHSYRLEFDPEESCTKISPGYFWRPSDEAH
jgi:DNA sulfur modification protein DndD